jgi:ubiquinone/menaquinone biosynthesis C-methylase UbiE
MKENLWNFACNVIHTEVYSSLVEFIKNVKDLPQGFVYCDVGSGISLNYLNDKLNPDIYKICIDISLPTLKLVKKSENVDVIQADAAYLPLRSDSIDVMSSFWLLLHLDENNVKKTCYEFFRVSRNYIVLDFHEPDFVYWLFDYFKYKKLIKPERYRNLFYLQKINRQF